MPDPLQDIEARRLYRHGLGLAQHGDFLRAEQYIIAALERGYPIGDALPALLRVCVAGRRFSTALAHAQPYLRDHPDDWSLRYVVATLHLGLGHARRARLELEHVIADVPNEPVPYYTLGSLHRDLDEVERAQVLFSRYLELAPSGDHVAEVHDWMEHPVPPPAIVRAADHETTIRDTEGDDETPREIVNDVANDGPSVPSVEGDVS